MPIAELGYRQWQGKRTGAMRRWMAITRSEIAIAYQGSRMLRRFLIFAWMPILYFCPFFLAIGYVADPANDLSEGSILTELAEEFFTREAILQLRANPELILPGIWSIAFYFFFAYTQSILSMIVVAIVGPPLIAKDLRTRAFLVYFSKPICPWQYVLGKLAAVIFFVFIMTLFPALFLYLVGVALSPDMGTLLATLPIILKIVLSSIVIAVPIALVVLLLSSLTKDRRVATFVWVAVWIFGEIAFRVLTATSNFSASYKPPPWASLLSLRELTTRATACVFELQGSIESVLRHLGDSGDNLDRSIRELASDMGDPYLMDRSLSRTELLDIAASGYPPAVSIVVLTVLSVGCALFILRRATRQLRV